MVVVLHNMNIIEKCYKVQVTKSGGRFVDSSPFLEYNITKKSKMVGERIYREKAED